VGLLGNAAQALLQELRAIVHRQHNAHKWQLLFMSVDATPDA
jgi:hypothetical protein